MYKGELVDLEYEADNLNEPSFDIERDAWLELDLVSQCID